MSIDMNRVFFAGRLTEDPTALGGGKGCRFSAASNRVYRNREGEKVEETTYMPITVWGGLSELVMDRCYKGSTVLVEGRLEVRKFEGDDGENKKYVNIVAQDIRFVDSPKSKDTESYKTSSNKTEVSGVKLPPGTNQATVDALKVLLGSK